MKIEGWVVVMLSPEGKWENSGLLTAMLHARESLADAERDELSAQHPDQTYRVVRATLTVEE